MRTELALHQYKNNPSNARHLPYIQSLSRKTSLANPLTPNRWVNAGKPLTRAAERAPCLRTVTSRSQKIKGFKLGNTRPAVGGRILCVRTCGVFAGFHRQVLTMLTWFRFVLSILILLKSKPTAASKGVSVRLSRERVSDSSKAPHGEKDLVKRARPGDQSSHRHLLGRDSFQALEQAKSVYRTTFPLK